ncbi:MAG: hypothetical protein P1U47_14555 [Zhongshania sp.]|uniref:COG4705 family protein n=1 Tax=Zhongshania sp. TaxID=1971902 RepID=UPI00262877F5|nr:hypothetical protein [Zhongshania sp.]MDF1693598.1 hypothetical protein [Zhongshania sp.]
MNDGVTNYGNKVAQIGLSFWLMKICATTLGETAGDLLSMTLNIGYGSSSLILIGLFFISLLMQLGARRFHPALYWSVILTTSTAGTTMSDYMDRTLGLGYATGSMILVGLLAVVLATWAITEKSLSVSNINTVRAELLYWIAILCSNTLGTALGDYLADDSGLGFMGGALLIGSLIMAIALTAYLSRVNRIFLFWLAFVLTRPFGATLGDLMSKPLDKGGLDFGTVGSSAVLAALLVAMVGYAMWRRSPEPVR